MRKYIFLFFVLISTIGCSAQKESLKKKVRFTIGMQANNIKGSAISSSLSKHYIKWISLDKGFVGGLRLGMNWRKWSLTYRSSFTYLELFHTLVFNNGQGEYDYYDINFNQKSLINALEISRTLVIPRSDYFFEIGFGAGVNYLIPEKKIFIKSLLNDEFPNEYNITNSVVNYNPYKQKTLFINSFLRFYRQLGKHVVGVNVDLIDVENYYIVDFFTDNKYAFSTSGRTKTYKGFSQFSFGFNYKVMLGK